MWVSIHNKTIPNRTLKVTTLQRNVTIEQQISKIYPLTLKMFTSSTLSHVQNTTKEMEFAKWHKKISIKRTTSILQHIENQFMKVLSILVQLVFTKQQQRVTLHYIFSQNIRGKYIHVIFAIQNMLLNKVFGNILNQYMKVNHTNVMFVSQYLHRI